MPSWNRLARTCLFFAIAALLGWIGTGRAEAINNLYTPTMSEADLVYYLNNPRYATFAKYDAKDSAGNTMSSPSILQMTGQPYKYAAVYHTPFPVGTDYRFDVNLAVSNDLRNWTFVRTLQMSAAMPKIAQVAGASWLVMTHETWLGLTGPAKVSFKLFYDATDLLNGTVRSTWDHPSFVSDWNGTPSVYSFHLALYDGWYCVDGQYGFHYLNGSQDRNANTTIVKLFHPTMPTVTYPSDAGSYNSLLNANGVTHIGQRDTIVTSSGRYNVQEGNISSSGLSWDLWRLWLYKFGDAYYYPTGTGSVTMLSPATTGGSTSLGNPSVSIVDSPSGSGKSLIISYFIFSEGAAPGEAGSLLYYFDI